MHHAPFSRGVLLLVLAAICWSTAGLFTRWIALDPWTVLFWRAVFGTILTGACGLLAGGRASAPASRHGQGVIVLWMTLGMLTFIPALAATSVASVAVIHGAIPLIVAGLSRIWLGERFRATTVFAALLALGGVAVMASQRNDQVTSIGLMLALVMAFSMAMTAVAFRRHPTVGVWRAGCLSNLLTACVTAFAADPLAAASTDLAKVLLFALVQMTLGLGLYVGGTRRLPAADGAVIGLLEAPLAPLWVWFSCNETPAGRTLLGGALVLAASAGHMLAARNHQRDAGTSSKRRIFS